MLKFHGTPISGTKRDAILFLTGRNGLVSYAAQQHLPEVLSCCDRFILDNGAFTYWKRKKGNINENAYRKWVTPLLDHPSMEFFIIPDIIDGTEKENNDLVRRWRYVKNAAPVYHMGESVRRFVWLSGLFRTVCLGSTGKWATVGSKLWWDEMANAMDKLCPNGTPPCGLHGLRMLNPNIFTKLPLRSSDSCNASLNSRFCTQKGFYPNLERWQGAERIARRIECFQSASVWSRDNLLTTHADIGVQC